jgi:glycosyltransferase involved in cell wall biosynthesis
MHEILPVRPLISVLMPVCNGVGYVGAAIDSIVNQTLLDWELVVIDNASTDGTGALVRSRAANDARIVLRRTDGDIGELGGFSTGVALCRGEWTALMYAEDRAMPNRLERQLAFMLQNRDVAVVSCLAHYTSAGGEAMPAVDLPLSDVAEGPESEELAAVLHRGAFMRHETLASLVDDESGVQPWSQLDAVGSVLVQPEYLMQCRIESSSDAARLDLAQLKYLWIEDCVLAKHEGLAEPTWEQFLWRHRFRPLLDRLAHSRHALRQRLHEEAIRHSREAGQG